jgi:hypothetical protein
MRWFRPRRGPKLGKLLAVAASAAVAALALAGVATADREQIHLTAAGQAAARAAILTRADIGAASGWTGNTKKPSLSSTPPCSNFKPKQSDLVLIGAAESVWKHPGLQFDSHTQVLQTPEMVRLDWQRTVLPPQVLPCLRSGLEKGLGATAHVVSLRRLDFPRLATYTRAIRALVDVEAPTAKVRIFVDVVVVGRGQTEITLTTTAPFAAEQVVKAAEVRLAGRLVSRIRM